MSPDYIGLMHALMPEMALVLGALIVLGFDLITGQRRTAAERLRAAVTLGGFAVVVAAGGAMAAGFGGPVFGGVLTLDTIGLFTRLGVLLLALLSLTLAPGTSKLRNPAEFVAVILFATVGFTLMAVAQQLLLVFLAIELASLSLYILAGFDKTRPESAEAALKYFLFGGMAAAFMLFGFSLLYGLTGSIELHLMSESLAAGTSGPLLKVALVMVLVAFGFKAAAAPFHLWAPDVYEGCATGLDGVDCFGFEVCRRHGVPAFALARFGHAGRQLGGTTASSWLAQCSGVDRIRIIAVGQSGRAGSIQCAAAVGLFCHRPRGSHAHRRDGNGGRRGGTVDVLHADLRTRDRRGFWSNRHRGSGGRLP